MWQLEQESNAAVAPRCRIQIGNRYASFREVIQWWASSEQFRSFFTQLLVNSRMRAFRWETPCVTSHTMDRDFEWVLLGCNPLERPADPLAFKEHFSSSSLEVIRFANLGRNAILVVPTPHSTNHSSLPVNYAHLCGFLSTASHLQIQALWQTVAEAMLERISKKPVWLSTAGMGVAWLHVRLDDQPKYYGYDAYRNSHYARSLDT